MGRSYFNGDNISDLAIYGLAVFYLLWSQGCNEEKVSYQMFLFLFGPYVLVLESPTCIIPHNKLMA